MSSERSAQLNKVPLTAMAEAAKFRENDRAPAPALGPRPGPRPGSRPGPRPCVSLKRLLSQPQKRAQRDGRKRCLTTTGPGTEPDVETSPVLNK